jgi:hypothetical protein
MATAACASGAVTIWRRHVTLLAAPEYSCCRFSCRFTRALSGIAKGEQRQITLSVNDLQVSCRTSYTPSFA